MGVRSRKMTSGTRKRVRTKNANSVFVYIELSVAEVLRTIDDSWAEEDDFGYPREIEGSEAVSVFVYLLSRPQLIVRLTPSSEHCIFGMSTGLRLRMMILAFNEGHIRN
jgi:hypothetical protein